jgi:hypothetical protein
MAPGEVRYLVVPDAMIVATVMQEYQGVSPAGFFVPDFVAVIVDCAHGRLPFRKYSNVFCHK